MEDRKVDVAVFKVELDKAAQEVRFWEDEDRRRWMEDRLGPLIPLSVNGLTIIWSAVGVQDAWCTSWGIDKTMTLDVVSRSLSMAPCYC